jgi:hypothetical protein
VSDNPLSRPAVTNSGRISHQLARPEISTSLGLGTLARQRSLKKGSWTKIADDLFRRIQIFSLRDAWERR